MHRQFQMEPNVADTSAENAYEVSCMNAALRELDKGLNEYEQVPLRLRLRLPQTNLCTEPVVDFCGDGPIDDRLQHAMGYDKSWNATQTIHPHGRIIWTTFA
eukprot:gb/GECG01004009.1/.p1 GENE.gb/GECG01004009.1/~~gb/GECG01004009.1/.p1  ORF type:complete len:102 (+),score=10.24 gb/GECG01004009.1/:1-306(+)